MTEWMSEQKLYFTQRSSSTFSGKILPALEAGHLVLCDRFVDSSLAYQGAGRRIGIAPIASLMRLRQKVSHQILQFI